MMLSKTISTKRSASFFVSSAARATSSTSSAFVMHHLGLKFNFLIWRGYVYRTLSETQWMGQDESTDYTDAVDASICAICGICGLFIRRCRLYSIQSPPVHRARPFLRPPLTNRSSYRLSAHLYRQLLPKDQSSLSRDRFAG